MTYGDGVASGLWSRPAIPTQKPFNKTIKTKYKQTKGNYNKMNKFSLKSKPNKNLNQIIPQLERHLRRHMVVWYSQRWVHSLAL